MVKYKITATLSIYLLSEFHLEHCHNLLYSDSESSLLKTEPEAQISDFKDSKE